MAKNTKPAIRFKGFTDDWEQRKLGEVATEMIAGGDVDKELLLEEGHYPVIANALTNDGIVGYYNDQYRIKAPAVTVTGRGDVGHAKARNVDFTPVVRLLSIKTNHDVYFLENAINTLKIVIESTGVPQLTVPQLAKYEISFPKALKEEEKIGQYFANLDHLITLHQRKYDSLVNVKKAMLEKMFPKNGETVPEIRFKGFTDDWEQRKLGEVATEMIAGGDVDKELLLEEGHYPVIANALTNDGIVGYYNDQYRIKAPAVTVTGRGDVGHAKARNVDFTPVVRLLSIKTNHDVYFLENAINTLKIVIESTGVPQLTVPQLAKYEISFPKALKEEEKIGQYFANLDHLITLHQRKLEKLKNIKKSCLEKMFV
jgi:type I restriction enzyme S subunit